VDALLSFAAALLSLRLAASLLQRFRERRDPALALWCGALAAYAVASGALAWSSADGWSSASFRVYYCCGALLAAALLGFGSLARAGRSWAAPVALAYAGLAVGVALAMPVHGTYVGTAIPHVQAHLAFLPARLLAIVASSLGGLAVVGVALLTIRRRPLGNALIVAGVVVASGNGLAGAGVAGTALFTLVGVVLLYAGFVAPARLGALRVPLLGVLAALLAAGAAFAGSPRDAPPASRLIPQVVTVGGRHLNYWQYLPPPSFTGKPAVLIFLHGYGERGSTGDPAELGELFANGPVMWVHRGDDLCFGPRARRSCFLLLAPQAVGEYDWFGPKVVPVVQALIERARALGGDMSRVYLTGLSMGGIGTWNFAGARGEGGAATPGSALAAIVPIAGYADGDSGCIVAANRLAVWAFHGTADQTVDVRGSIAAVRDVNACTKPRPRRRALLTLYQGVGHHSWERTYDPSSRFDPTTGRALRRGTTGGLSIYAWLLEQRRR
jgi:poly(3-hydroxybutyrate) depolymerase